MTFMTHQNVLSTKSFNELNSSHGDSQAADDPKMPFRDSDRALCQYWWRNYGTGHLLVRSVKAHINRQNNEVKMDVKLISESLERLNSMCKIGTNESKRITRKVFLLNLTRCLH